MINFTSNKCANFNCNTPKGWGSVNNLQNILCNNCYADSHTSQFGDLFKTIHSLAKKYVKDNRTPFDLNHHQATSLITGYQFIINNKQKLVNDKCRFIVELNASSLSIDDYEHEIIAVLDGNDLPSTVDLFTFFELPDCNS